MTVISVNNISLSFGTNEIIKDISFSLDESDKMGIVGVNGCGKSTLFSLILGDREADSGNVYISKQKSIGVLRQNDAFLAVDEELGEAGKNASALEVMYGTFRHLMKKEEQLRALENGISIKVLTRELESIGVDTPEDLAKAEARLAEMNK